MPAYILLKTHVEWNWCECSINEVRMVSAVLSRDYNSKGSSFYLLCLTASSQTAWINFGINMLHIYLERITVLSALGDRFISRFNSARYDRPQLSSQASYLQSMPWFNEYMFSSLSKQHTELHTAGTQDI